jgi:hypothetical protein
MTVSLEQAAKNALAGYLRTAAALGGVTGLTVLDRWPDAGIDIATPAVSIIFAGDTDEELYDPILVATSNLDATHVLATYEFASLRCPLQLDVWCTTDVSRDNLVKLLDDALREGVGVTLSQGVSMGNPVRDGVLVPLSDGWPGNVDLYFDRLKRVDTPDSVTRSEYRAMSLGDARMVRTIQKTLPRAARLTLKSKVHQLGPVPAPTSITGPSDNITVSASGITHSQG